jgi:O-antigen/teichoic acid export membrane protein
MLDNFVLIKSYLEKLTIDQNRTAKAGRQILYSFILQAISIIIGLMYVPLLLNYFTQEKYGIWLTLTSILGWFSFFDIGLGNGLRNKLTEALAFDNKLLGRKYVSTTYALLICIFSLVLIIFYISNNFINWNLVLNTKSVKDHELYVLTSIVFTFFIIRFIVQLIGVIYFADQKPSVNNAINTAGNMLSFLFVFILSKASTNGNLIFSGSVISIMPVLLFILISIYSFNKRYIFLKPSLRTIDFKLSRGLINMGSRFFFMQVTAIIIFSTSSFFIAQFFGPEEVVVYNIVFKYFQLPVMVFSIILTPIWSAVTDAYVKSDYSWLRITLKRLNILSFIFAFGIVFMIFISSFIYKVWIGEKIIIPLNLTISMAIYSMLNILVAPYSSFINGTGKLKLTTSLSFLGILVYLISVFTFSHLFKNSCGVIIAIIVTSLIGAFIQPIQTYKILNRKASGIWLST